MRSFKETRHVVPPGGVWFFRLGDDHVESPIYEFAVRRTGEILRAHGVGGDAGTALAEYMCPHMPAWFCRGEGPVSPVITGREARDNAVPYFGRDLVPVDRVLRRMAICSECMRHRRDFCLHCEGHDSWISGMFRGRRPKLPADDASGCCTCAKTFEAVVASVEYGPDEGIWEGVPDNCWRKTHE